MKYKTLSFLLVINFLTASIAFAAPQISASNGIWSHKGTIAIQGIGFGVKNPAAPRIWDACDDDSTSSLSTFWPTDTYPKTCSGTPSETPYLMDYRESFHGFSTMPHSRVTKFLSAAAITCNGNWNSPFADTLVTTAPWPGDTLYISYYYRMPGNWSLETSAFGDNLKEISANGGNGTYLAGTDNYLGWDNGRTPMIEYPANGKIRGCETFPECSYPGGGDNGHLVNNPRHDWIHAEILWDATYLRYNWSDGSDVSEQGYPVAKSTRTDGNSPVTFSLGGFVRWPRNSQTGNHRLWAAIYADNTYSRVMLGNSSRWGDCTVRAPQIPSEWSNTNIAVKVNLGALTDTTAYLFVFDADNNHNEVGIPVTLDADGSIATNVPDIPDNLKVITD